MYARFGLTLVVNHACNLRCTYCYTGQKLRRRMPLGTGRLAIDRALRSLSRDGTLELGFFGGEPLIEADLVLELIAYARTESKRHQAVLTLHITTNGTLESDAAWLAMTLPEMQLAISHDGLPAVHDRHRVTIDGQPSSARVLDTITRLVNCGKRFRVVMVVRPDNVDELPAGLEFLWEQGVRRFNPSLDLWALWTRADGKRLQDAIHRAATFWRDRLPSCSVSWFDEKTARLARVPMSDTARCGFGAGEIAVTSAGDLYPCERLVGADEPDNPMRLPGNVFDGGDFLSFPSPPGKTAVECTQCSLQSLCSTTCRCSNYVRTRDVTRPDGLLCLWDQACHQATVRALKSPTYVNY